MMKQQFLNQILVRFKTINFIRARQAFVPTTHFAIFLLSILMGLLIQRPITQAAVQIPTGLTKTDRQEALRIIGFGTSSKILSDPYPLGGYDGLEAGISVELLPAGDLGHLGAGLTDPQSDIAFPKFTIGKGLYNNLDLFFHFIPYNQKSELSQWGGTVRWGFYQAFYLPLSTSINLHFNSSNISNLLTSQTVGADIIGGINADNVALYAGGGPLRSSGSFLGGTSGVTDSNSLELESVTGLHFVVGATVHLAQMFIATQIDHYTQTLFSAKIGLRF
jgi:hypothetical protein